MNRHFQVIFLQVHFQSGGLFLDLITRSYIHLVQRTVPDGKPCLGLLGLFLTMQT